MPDAAQPFRPVSPPPRPRAFAAYPWRRLVLAMFFLAVLSLVFWAVLFIAIAQFALRIFDADASADLASFGRRIGLYMAEMAAYVTFSREDAPFPFQPFPRA